MVYHGPYSWDIMQWHDPTLFIDRKKKTLDRGPGAKLLRNDSKWKKKEGGKPFGIEN